MAFAVQLTQKPTNYHTIALTNSPLVRPQRVPCHRTCLTFLNSTPTTMAVATDHAITKIVRVPWAGPRHGGHDGQRPADRSPPALRHRPLEQREGMVEGSTREPLSVVRALKGGESVSWIGSWLVG